MTDPLIGTEVEWQKAGRGCHERQRATYVRAVPVGETGREVRDSIMVSLEAADAELRAQGKPGLVVDGELVRLQHVVVRSRHIAFAEDTHTTERVLVMARDHRAKQVTPIYRFFCPNRKALGL